MWSSKDLSVLQTYSKRVDCFAPSSLVPSVSVSIART
jgi:hypothetical protein